MQHNFTLKLCLIIVAPRFNHNRRGRRARESVWKSHSRLLPPHGGRTERDIRVGYGLRSPIAGQNVNRALIMLLRCNFSRLNFNFLHPITDTTCIMQPAGPCSSDFVSRENNAFKLISPVFVLQNMNKVFISCSIIYYFLDYKHCRLYMEIM